MALKTVTEYFGVGRDEIDQGEEIITVKVGGDNFLAKAQNVHIIYNFSSIVSWADGSDEEIAAMVAAHMDGKLDLTEYWSVGDERTVHLSAMSATGVGESHVAQDVTMVLVDKNNENYTYTSTPTSGNTHPAFIVQLKNGLGSSSGTERGYMNSTNTNSGSWQSTARRTWCNNTFCSSINSTLRAIFHQVNVKTASEGYNDSSSLQTTQDYFFLPAIAEVYGKARSSYSSPSFYSALTENNALTQWEYYNKNSGYQKKYDGDTSSSFYLWWSRSPSRSSREKFCHCAIGGTVFDSSASNRLLIIPCGCI